MKLCRQQLRKTQLELDKVLGNELKIPPVFLHRSSVHEQRVSGLVDLSSGVGSKRENTKFGELGRRKWSKNEMLCKTPSPIQKWGQFLTLSCWIPSFCCVCGQKRVLSTSRLTNLNERSVIQKEQTTLTLLRKRIELQESRASDDRADAEKSIPCDHFTNLL